MKQLLAANIPDLRERNIDIYLTVVIAFVIGLATLTPVEKLTVVSGSDKLYHLLSFAIDLFLVLYNLFHNLYMVRSNTWLDIHT
jgi:hypothetical protein